MSHAVTIRTTTTSTASAIIVNTGYFKTAPGILKLFQVILGIICVGLVANYIGVYDNRYYYWSTELFFLLMATTFLITTTLLLVSCLASFTSATLLPKTLFEVVYHVAAMVLLLVAAGLYISQVTESNLYYYRTRSYEGRFAAGVIGLINSVLYGIAVFFSCRHYRNM